MHNFTPATALLGGVLIGLAACLTLFTRGRMAGVSGIFANALASPDRDARGFSILFLAGLLVGGAVLRWALPEAFEPSGAGVSTLLRFGIAGALVGAGTRWAGGCTSGHGVCGLSLRSRRSLVGVLIFMAAGILAVLFRLHTFGAQS